MENLLDREQYWIDYYKSYDINIGYNISKFVVGFMRGRTLSEETKRKIGLKSRDPNRKRAVKKVYQFDLDGNLLMEWESGTQASKELNIRFENISQCCCHPDKFKTSNGFIWSFADTVDVEEHKHRLPENPKRNKKEIVQLSKRGKFIKYWPSLKQAGEELGISHGSISNVCKKKNKTCGGFIWMYRTEYEDMMKYDKKKTGS